MVGLHWTYKNHFKGHHFPCSSQTVFLHVFLWCQRSRAPLRYHFISNYHRAESNTSAPYNLDLLLSIERDGQLHTSIYNKRDDFNFQITNFPFLFLWRLYLTAYTICPGLLPIRRFILRATRISNKLIQQGYVKERLKSSLNKFYGWYGDLIKQYEVPLSRMLNDIL